MNKNILEFPNQSSICEDSGDSLSVIELLEEELKDLRAEKVFMKSRLVKLNKKIRQIEVRIKNLKNRL